MSHKINATREMEKRFDWKFPHPFHNWNCVNKEEKKGKKVKRKRRKSPYWLAASCYIAELWSSAAAASEECFSISQRTTWNTQCFADQFPVSRKQMLRLVTEAIGSQDYQWNQDLAMPQILTDSEDTKYSLVIRNKGFPITFSHYSRIKRETSLLPLGFCITFGH